MRRIDTHQHLWDLTRFTLPWLPESGPLSDSHTPERYAHESTGLGIEKTIYMEVDVTPEQRLAEAQYVFALCDDPANPMVGAVIGGDPAAEGFAAYLEATEHPGRKGVRQVLHGGQPTGYCLTREFHRGLALLGERGLLFDFCLRPDALVEARGCARAFPNSRFILDHCGNAPIHGSEVEVTAWKKGIEAVAECPNVVGKISGIIAQADSSKPLAPQLAASVNFTLDAFGPERVIFASDWPVCKNGATLAQWVETLETIVADRSQAEREALFFNNAARVYGIE
ncbi:MAG: amidohydrolase family protein [Armatimonas sp.]